MPTVNGVGEPCAGEPHARCAPCGASLYPHRRWEGLGRRFLGRLTDLEVKAEGDKSMSGKRWPSGGVQGGVPQDPRDMARAELPEAQSPVVNVRTRRNDA